MPGSRRKGEQEMEESREKEKFRGNEIFMNPYVVQMDKFADSLKHLSKTFLKLESYKGTFTKEELAGAKGDDG